MAKRKSKKSTGERWVTIRVPVSKVKEYKALKARSK